MLSLLYILAHFTLNIPSVDFDLLKHRNKLNILLVFI